MTPKRIVSVVLVFLSIALASAQSSGIVPSTGPWLHLVAWAGSMIAAALALLPALFGDAPVTLPTSAVEVAKKAGIGVLLLVALGSPAHAQHLGAGLAQGVVTSGTPPAADPGLVHSVVVAQAEPAPMRSDPTPAVPVVVVPLPADPPPVATNPTLPIVPPVCVECAKQIGNKIPVTSKWSGWYTAAILVGSGIAFTLDQLHTFGVIK